jgi:sensor domain CHASE-containing protein
VFSIKAKTGLIFLVFFCIFLTLYYFVQRSTIYPSFQSIEYEEARKNLFRASIAIYSEIDRIDSLCSDWSTSTLALGFLKIKSNDDLKGLLQPKSFINNRLNLILFCDSSGHTIWWDCLDLATGKRMDHMDSLKEHIEKTYLLRSPDPENLQFLANNILLANPYPLLLSSHSIIDPDHQGPIQGYLIMGRFLDPDLVEHFQDQSEFNFNIQPIKGNNVQADIKEIAAKITSENPHLIKADKKTIYAYTTAPDITGQKALLISATIPRKITQAGARSMGYAMISMLIVGVFVFFGLRYILQRQILTPVSDLTNHMSLIRQTAAMVAPPTSDRRDEIGVLTNEFERMLASLREKDDELRQVNSKLEEDIKERQRLINELEQALYEVKTLSGLLPICASCKKIRDDQGYWNQIESYISKHSSAEFSHSICPDCIKKLYPEVAEIMFAEKEPPIKPA